MDPRTTFGTKSNSAMLVGALVAALVAVHGPTQRAAARAIAQPANPDLHLHPHILTELQRCVNAAPAQPHLLIRQD